MGKSKLVDCEFNRTNLFLIIFVSFVVSFNQKINSRTRNRLCLRGASSYRRCWVLIAAFYVEIDDVEAIQANSALFQAPESHILAKDRGRNENIRHSRSKPQSDHKCLWLFSDKSFLTKKFREVFSAWLSKGAWSILIFSVDLENSFCFCGDLVRVGAAERSERWLQVLQVELSANLVLTS